MSLFEVRELAVRAGDVALRGVDLSVAAGEVVGLLGDEGGSLLLRTAAGLLAPAAGVVRVDGEDVTGLASAAVAARGVVLLPAVREPFAALTVRENLVAGASAAPGCGARGGLARSARADLVLGWFPVLEGARDVRAEALPADEAAVLTVAAAVARRPRLLLVDGLAPRVGVEAYGAVLAGVRAATVADGLSAVVADAAGDGTDEAAYDRVVVVAEGALREAAPTL